MAQIRDKEEHMWKKEEEVIINGSNTEEIHAKYHVVQDQELVQAEYQ